MRGTALGSICTFQGVCCTEYLSEAPTLYAHLALAGAGGTTARSSTLLLSVPSNLVGLLFIWYCEGVKEFFFSR